MPEKRMPSAEGQEEAEKTRELTRSLGWMVTRLAWIAARLVSSKSETRYASDASWSAITAEDWKRRTVWQKEERVVGDVSQDGERGHEKKRTLKTCAISRTRRWKGSLRMRSSVDFW